MSSPYICAFIGLPCSGKSTIARALYKLLQDGGGVPKWIALEETINNEALYEKELQTALRDSSITHIILDRYNMMQYEYDIYTRNNIQINSAFLLHHPESQEDYINECLRRFHKRGNGHKCYTNTNCTNEYFLTICTKLLKHVCSYKNTFGIDMRKQASAICDSVLWHIHQTTPLERFGSTVYALHVSKQYEKAVCNFYKHIYGCVIKIKHNIEKIIQLIPLSVLEGKKVCPGFHIPIKHLGHSMDPVWFVQMMKIHETIVQCVVTEILWDAYNVVACVKGNFQSDSKYPHIQIATSSEYIDSDALFEKTDIERLRCTIHLTGRYVFLQI